MKSTVAEPVVLPLLIVVLEPWEIESVGVPGAFVVTEAPAIVTPAIVTGLGVSSQVIVAAEQRTTGVPPLTDTSTITSARAAVGARAAKLRAVAA
jgi:hypothetical protein